MLSLPATVHLTSEIMANLKSRRVRWADHPHTIHPVAPHGPMVRPADPTSKSFTFLRQSVQSAGGWVSWPEALP
jgi:hypothetical protein